MQIVMRINGRAAFNAVCVAIFALSAFWVAWNGFVLPYKNWDLNAYVGAAISLHTDDKQVLYDETMRELESVRTPEQVEEIKQGKLSANPEAFAQQLPFYTIKPLYVSLMAALHAAGIGFAESTFYISPIAFLCLALVFALWRPEQLNYGLWLLSFVVITWLGDWPMRTLAHFSTPDALATFLCFTALFVLFKRRSRLAFGVVGAFAILARPDAVILMILTTAVAWMVSEDKGKSKNIELAIALLFFVLLYISVKFAIGGYNYPTLFYYSFIDKLALPAEAEVNLTFAEYFSYLMKGVMHIGFDVRIVPFAVISLFACLCYFMRPKCGQVWLWVLALAWGSFAARFALYPAWWEFRYHFIYYLVATAACAELIPPYLVALWQRFLAHRKAINS